MMSRMRTTLTLDDDLADKLKEFAQRRNLSFKQALNTVLRRGFVAQEPSRAGARRYQVEVFDSPFRAGTDPLRLNQLTDELEAEEAMDRGRR